ncbi:DNA methyltransferase [Lactiplantibacillus pingfangensis]|uniref:DNA methyltransferase n=1 Tax=Lactiplantibacillus pingfangensis TaxID=2559915 RepID=UPI0010F8424B|nr:DNA methyltransferase [Lactiplantibacillus pingfangensis]
MADENLIKSNKRVKEHGEVFTPKRIVNQMLNQPELVESLNSLSTTFMEPAAGEGAFLTELLRRKLILANKLSTDLKSYEANAEIVLSSLYGIELLEDNVKVLVMRMYNIFSHHYFQAIQKWSGKKNPKVTSSAMTIIEANMRQGDALKKATKDGRSIIFSEWKLLPVRNGVQKVQRIEYTLDAIINDKGPLDESVPSRKVEQLDLFGFDDEVDEEPKKRFKACKLVDIYKEEMEEVTD